MRNAITAGTALLTALVLAATPAFAAELSDTEDIDRYLDAAVESSRIPGLVALAVDRDSVIYAHTAGRRNVADAEPMTVDTIFRIASMTKPVAATAIMMLVEEGKLDLDDAAADFLPALAELEVVETFDPETGAVTTRPAREAITIRQLLSHSSGLAYPFASDVVTAAVAGGTGGGEAPLLYDPGTGWSYAGGIGFVGTVLERIEGVGIDTFMRDRIFLPLGMHDTSFIVPARSHFRVATVHRPDENGELVESANPIDIRSAPSGDGGLHSTAEDYAKFIQLFLNDGVAPDGTRLLLAASIARMQRSQLGPRTVTLQDEPTPDLARAFPLGAGRDGFGLGFQVTGAHDDATIRSPGSLSWAGIFNTEFWIDPENGIGGILLMQYLPFYDPDAIETLVGFEARLYERLDTGAAAPRRRRR